MERQPCPYRVYDDIGSAFTMGSVMGGVFHFLRSAKNAPSGERLKSAFAGFRSRAPVLGGLFNLDKFCFF